MKILIVEDHKATADTMVRILRGMTQPAMVDVRVASTLREGLEVSQQFKADVTLLDLCLPDTRDWHEVAESIRQFHPPVIVVTEIDDPDNAIMLECYRLGAKDFFPKSIALRIASVLISSITSAHLRNVMPGQPRDNKLVAA